LLQESIGQRYTKDMLIGKLEKTGLVAGMQLCILDLIYLKLVG